MGVAAYNRGSASIRRHYDEERREQQFHEDMRRAILTEIQSDQWRRKAMAVAVEARGFLGGAIRSCVEGQGRVYLSRLSKVNDAHSVWLNVNPRDQLARTTASINYSRAYYHLLNWMRGGFACPILDEAPRFIFQK